MSSQTIAETGGNYLKRVSGDSCKFSHIAITIHESGERISTRVSTGSKAPPVAPRNAMPLKRDKGPPDVLSPEEKHERPVERGNREPRANCLLYLKACQRSGLAVIMKSLLWGQRHALLSCHKPRASSLRGLHGVAIPWT